jgi:hypothetical protein
MDHKLGPEHHLDAELHPGALHAGGHLTTPSFTLFSVPSSPAWLRPEAFVADTTVDQIGPLKVLGLGSGPFIQWERGPVAPWVRKRIFEDTATQCAVAS